MQPCPPLTGLEGKTGKALTKKLIEVAWMYYDCADGKQQLIDASK
jgi:hypothetical protein